ncbi:MAG: RNA polymerase sigma factor [Spirochaetes bacterium]|nr:RNA polymerase sigma factor [Spirochaetota bacterium]
MRFEKVYKEYRNKIFRFTYNYTKDILEQEELVQDIFYNIFIGLKNFKKKSSLNTFIYAIARNTCVKYIKKSILERKKIDKLIRLYEREYEKSSYEKLILSEDAKYFLLILDKLQKDNREIFYLSEIERLKYREISEILHIPIGTVKSRLNRAKEKIVELVHLKTKEE